MEQIAASPQPGRANVEILSWLSRATLDVIGLAGFDYSFDALKFGEDSNELASAFSQIFNSAKSANLVTLLQGRIPILRWIVRLFSFLSSIVHIPITVFPLTRCLPGQNMDQHSQTLAKAQQTMRRIGLQLVREKQQAVQAEKASGGGTVLEKGNDKDLLSLLIKANMDKDIPPEQQLNLEQILNQIPTFMVAGECSLE